MASKKKLLQAAAGAASGADSTGINVEDLFSTTLYKGSGGVRHISTGVALTDGYKHGYGGSSVKFDRDTNSKLQFPSSSDFNFGTGDFTVETWVYWDNWDSDDRGLGPQIWDHGDSNNPGSLWIGWYGNTFYFRIDGLGNDLTFNYPMPYRRWTHVAVTRSSGTVKIFLDGVQKISAARTQNITQQTPVIGFNNDGGAYHKGYMRSHRVVKGTAVYTSAFTPPDPSVDLSAITGTVALTCQGSSPLTDSSASSHTVTNTNCVSSERTPVAVSSDGGLLWIKNRDDVGSNHVLFDTERPLISGAISTLYSNLANAAADVGGVDRFTSAGADLDSAYNTNSSAYNYTAYTFKKHEKFFDIQYWTGDGTGSRNISHNLNSVPGCITVKSVNNTASNYEWITYHRGMNSGTNPENYFMKWSSTAAEGTDSAKWNNTAPTSSVFQVGTDLNQSGVTYVAYIFAHNDGDGIFGPTGDQDIIACGTYTGNGDNEGPTVDIGWEPQYLWIKKVNGTQTWWVVDEKRGFADNYGEGVSIEPKDTFFRINGNAAEEKYSMVGPHARGFKLETSDPAVNGNFDRYIYLAIRRGPMAEPVSGEQVVESYVEGYSSGDYKPAIQFEMHYPDWAYVGSMSSTDKWYSGTRVIGGDSLDLESSNAGNAGYYYELDYAGAFESNWQTYFGWAWKRWPGVFDVVPYRGGTGEIPTSVTVGSLTYGTVKHNLGVAPELIMVKNRTGATDWVAAAPILGNGGSYAYTLTTNGNGAPSESGWFAPYTSTTETSDHFTVNNNAASHVGYVNNNYVAYLFASKDGISKVGTFTATSSTVNVDCGFTNGARFVMIKRTDTSGPWYFFDTKRGIVAGNDSALKWDGTDNPNSNNDWIDPISSGFATGSFLTSGTYLFLAIAT